MNVDQVGMDNLVTLRRLMVYADRYARRHAEKTDRIAAPSKDQIEMEDAILDGKDPALFENAAPISSDPVKMTGDQTQVNLSQLIARLKELKQNGGAAAQAENVGQAADDPNVRKAGSAEIIEYQESLSIQWEVKYTELKRVDGLVVNDKNQAETDRYRFDFVSSHELVITDKWTHRSTRVWGDPHVDVNDVAGDRDGEFTDLKESSTHTTFMLQDGTRLTFTAKDDGVIEKVDIFKGSQHVTGLGAGSKDFNEKTGFFNTKVGSGSSSEFSVPVGDVVYAGGDGNDWFDRAGKMIWGKTTGPVVTTRPDSIYSFQMRAQYEQSVSYRRIDTNV